MNETKNSLIPKKIGIKLEKPTLFLIYRDNATGKTRKRKIPVRDLLIKEKNLQKPACKILSDLVQKHNVLKSFNEVQLQRMIVRLGASSQENIDMNIKALIEKKLISNESESLPTLPEKNLNDLDLNKL
ncbi:hypothetical protein HK099_003477, partial [Clydaea vesicula]